MAAQIEAVDTTEPTFRAASLRERYIAIALVLLSLAAIVALAPIAGRPVGRSTAFLAAIFSATTIMMFVSALISYNWYVATGSGPYAMFATAYGSTAAIILAYGLTFPQIAPAGSLLSGRGEVAPYLWLAYHMIFVALLGVAVASQAFFTRRERLGEPVDQLVRRYVASVGFGTVFCVLAVCAFASKLPPLVAHHDYGGFFNGPIRVTLFGEVAAVSVGLIGLTRLRRRIDLWLAITLASTLAELTLATILTTDRFSIGWYSAKVLSVISLDTLFFAQFGQIGTVLEALARDRRALTTNAGRDALTGLVNRRGFDEQLENLWHSSRATSTPIALIIIDIDFFKQYNDRYGHPGGDDALRIVARTLGAATRRPSDICARIGGEEFALLLPATDAGGAFLVAETVRATLEERYIPHLAGLGGRLTVSLGVACSTDRGVDSPHVLHERADEALYEAKRLGRNRVFANRRPPSALTPRARA